jgi:hypothetical protein
MGLESEGSCFFNLSERGWTVSEDKRSVRALQPFGLEERQLKLYVIGEPDAALIASAKQLADDHMPVTTGLPSVGFVLVHPGKPNQISIWWWEGPGQAACRRFLSVEGGGFQPAIGDQFNPMAWLWEVPVLGFETAAAKRRLFMEDGRFDCERYMLAVMADCEI